MNLKHKIVSTLSSHTFFSGIFVLFVTISALQITLINYSFKTNENYYPLYITVGSFFFLVKSFLTGFNFIDRSINKNLWFFLVFHSLTMAMQVWFIITGLTKLMSSSYPNEFFLYALIASIVYLSSILVSKTTSMVSLTLISCTTTGVIYGMVSQLLFGGNFLFLQIVTLIYLIFQVAETFLASREYFSKEV
jgi:hypothetical protein